MEFLSDDEIDRCCEVLYQDASPLIIALASKQAVVESFRTDLLESLRQTVDQEFIDWFYGLYRSRLSGLFQSSDFANRCVRLPCGHKMIAGIRFMDGRPESPFVEILSRTFPLADETALDEAWNWARETFHAFFPGYLGVLAGTQALQNGLGREWTPWYRWMGAPVASLGMHSKSKRKSDLVTVELVREARAYADYQQMYERWADCESFRNDVPQPESVRDFELAVAEGNVYRCLAEGRSVGYTIVARRIEYGVPIMSIVDILIDPECAQQGFGRHLLETACERQMTDSTEAIFAHVHAVNERSYGLLRAIGLGEIGRFVMRSMSEVEK